MNALEVIREIEALGGSLRIEDGELKVRSKSPLTERLLGALSEHKPAIIVALGGPLDIAIAGVLTDIRPYLSPALQQLPDDRLLALVNWNIITAWNTSLRRAGERTPPARRSR